MKHLAGVTKASIALGLFVLTALAAGCIVIPRHEGYWDREHHRYWHERGWVRCGRDDEHCRD